jgi:hypothetical protein
MMPDSNIYVLRIPQNMIYYIDLSEDSGEECEK